LRQNTIIRIESEKHQSRYEFKDGEKNTIIRIESY